MPAHGRRATGPRATARDDGRRVRARRLAAVLAAPRPEAAAARPRRRCAPVAMETLLLLWHVAVMLASTMVCGLLWFSPLLVAPMAWRALPCKTCSDMILQRRHDPDDSAAGPAELFLPLYPSYVCCHAKKSAAPGCACRRLSFAGFRCRARCSVFLFCWPAGYHRPGSPRSPPLQWSRWRCITSPTARRIARRRCWTCLTPAWCVMATFPAPPRRRQSTVASRPIAARQENVMHHCAAAHEKARATAQFTPLAGHQWRAPGATSRGPGTATGSGAGFGRLLSWLAFIGNPTVCGARGQRRAVAPVRPAGAGQGWLWRAPRRRAPPFSAVKTCASASVSSVWPTWLACATRFGWPQS